MWIYALVCQVIPEQIVSCFYVVSILLMSRLSAQGVACAKHLKLATALPDSRETNANGSTALVSCPTRPLSVRVMELAQLQTHACATRHTPVRHASHPRALV